MSRFILLVTLVLLSFQASLVRSVAVMSIDLGSEWMKIAVVSPGVPMEIALNPESKRKTPVAVSLRNGERTFGSDALSVGVKYPKSCYFYLLDLLGKPYDHPTVKKFQKMFPFYDIKAHPERGTVIFQHDEETVYSVEELMAMILKHAKKIAESYAEQRIKDTTITVPTYFNQAERRSLLLSAELAQINVLQLISEPMAVALNYGMFRRKEINGTVKHLMFYDMGAQDTTVSIVAYQIIKTKERGFTETHPQAQILGIGYDRHLGGLEIQIRLREFLADKFNELGKTKTDVRSVPRAMGKLFKEAGRVKNVLSANTNTYAQIENVMEDIDFRMEITRDTLLDMNKEYFEKVLDPINSALSASGITLEEISEVILVGAGTRIPKVQEILKEFLNKELGKSLNTDESAAMGAIYKAADLSTGFKVKKFITKDAVIFPIDVDFSRTFENDDGESVTKNVNRALFPNMNSYPQKKIMTFNKHIDDFTFYVNHNNFDHLSKSEIELIGSYNLSEVDVTGVAKALTKYAETPNIEPKGIKAHFNLDASGILNVTAVESIFEKTITVEEQEEEEKKKEQEKKDKDAAEEEDCEKESDDGSWANLGDTISSFFNKENSDDKHEDKKKEDVKKEKKKCKKKKDEKTKDKDGKEKKDKKKEEKKKPKEPKVETIKEPLEFETRLVDLKYPSEKLLDEFKTKLKALDEHDEIKIKKETALNNLESFVIDVRDKLYQEVYEDSATDEEKEKFQTKCSEISDWIDEEVTPDTEVDILEAKFKEIKDLTSPWFARVKEHIDRPEVLGALDQMLNTSSKFLSKAKNKTGEDGLFTDTELESLEKKINEIEDWKTKMLEDQEKQPKYEMPLMRTNLISEKALDLDREVKYLLNKAKIAQAEKEKEKRLKEAEEKKAKEEAEKEKKKKAKDAKKSKTNEEGDEKEENKENTEEIPKETEDETKPDPEETIEQPPTEETPTEESTTQKEEFKKAEEEL